jgi:hypothetical protein
MGERRRGNGYRWEWVGRGMGNNGIKVEPLFLFLIFH